MSRPGWDEYFIQMADAVSRRATCDRGRSGCVIVRDNRILVAGYVGSPMGLPHCDDVGHQFKTVVHEDGHSTNHCVRTVHAEQNAICQAARFGIPLDGATLYCRMTPCRVCAMMIINCGIKRVYCEKKYHDAQEPETMLRDAGVFIEYKNDDIVSYPDQKPEYVRESDIRKRKTAEEYVLDLEQQGRVHVERKNNGYHWIICDIVSVGQRGIHRWDLWPTTGNWCKVKPSNSSDKPELMSLRESIEKHITSSSINEIVNEVNRGFSSSENDPDDKPPWEE